METAIFAGGCFWCTEAYFLQLNGVHTVVSGYIGGHTDNPTYAQICTGLTGHAEAIQISFDPALISFDNLLNVFFMTHDPTTLNRQGHDAGTQYRSAVFYLDETQKTATEKVIAEFTTADIWGKPIVTEITAATVFFPAEKYHQNYFTRNPSQSYCQIVINPKITKFRQHFARILKQK